MPASALTPCATAARPPAPDDSSSVTVQNDDVAGQTDALAVQRLQGDDQAGDPALHVVGAATEEVAVSLRQDERVAEPLVARLHVHRVDVAVEQDAAAAAGAAEDGGELGPADEVEAGRHEPVAVPGRLRLPHVRLRAERLEPRGEQPLQPLLVARRVARAGARSCRSATSSAVRPTSSSFASRTAWTTRSSSADCSCTRTSSVDGHLRRRRAYNGGAGATPRSSGAAGSTGGAPQAHRLFYDAAVDGGGPWAT